VLLTCVVIRAAVLRRFTLDSVSVFWTMVVPGILSPRKLVNASRGKNIDMAEAGGRSVPPSQMGRMGRRWDDGVGER
jgi:hypothetical protein